MKLRVIELRRLAVPLVRRFRTSFGTQSERDVLLVRVVTDDGEGLGECVALAEPIYSSEYVAAAQSAIADHLAPRLFAVRDLSGRGVQPALARSTPTLHTTRPPRRGFDDSMRSASSSLTRPSSRRTLLAMPHLPVACRPDLFGRVDCLREHRRGCGSSATPPQDRLSGLRSSVDRARAIIGSTTRMANTVRKLVRSASTPSAGAARPPTLTANPTVTPLAVPIRLGR